MHHELHSHSWFSFLEGASAPEAMVARAAELGYRSLALTDRGGVYGMVRFSRAAREVGVRAIAGALVTLGAPDAADTAVVLARGAAGWRTLCGLLTRAHAAHPKGRHALPREALAADASELLVLIGHEESRLARLVDAGREEEARAELRWWRAHLPPHHLAISLQAHGTPLEARRCRRLVALGEASGVPCAWTQGALYAAPGDRMLQDLLTAIRHGVPLAAAAERLRPNDGWCLQPLSRLRHLAGDDEPLRVAAQLAERCEDPLPALRYRMPELRGPGGESSDAWLRTLAEAGVRERYGAEPGERVWAQLRHELEVIRRLRFAGYFLVVHDIVSFCRTSGILAQGRGSAANSVVCYALGITAVDPVGLDLLFERFLSEERPEYPDIDLDIAAGRREEVLQYVYRRWGEAHAAMVCNVITFRRRLATRESARALGFSEPQIDRIARAIGRRSADDLLVALHEHGLDRDVDAEVLRTLAWCVTRLRHVPRHLAIHSGGMIVSAAPLHELVPIEPASMEGRTVVQWDKDDVEDAGLCKIDLLGLGMLEAIQEAIGHIERVHGVPVDPAHLDCADAEVYDMLCAADTVGLFQVESRAQMTSLPRIRPRTFYDLAIQVAIIRPGPIQGEMVHPFIRRRNGEEPVRYLHPSLEPILRRTLGVPLFQEQGMKIAVHAAGLTPGEADALRRAMGSKRSHEKMARLSRRLIEGMAARGIRRDVAERIYRQLAAFADYGFPESHALSFALIVYVSAWLRRWWPAEFLCALLNAQPMGFYSPDSLLQDARRRGVEILPLCAAQSAWEATIEVVDPETGEADPEQGPTGQGVSGDSAVGPGESVEKVPGDGGARPSGARGSGALLPAGARPRHRVAVRLGFAALRGAGSRARTRFEAARSERPFGGLVDFVLRSGLRAEVLEQAALAGAFDVWTPERRQAAWQVAAVARQWGPLAPFAADAQPDLPLLDGVEAIREEYRVLGLSVRHHAIEMLPAEVREGYRPIAELRDLAEGTFVTLLGVVTCRQSPETAKGFVFLTLEDPTGMLNVIVRPDVFVAHRALVREATFLIVGGILERRGATHLKMVWARPPRTDTAPTLRARSFH